MTTTDSTTGIVFLEETDPITPFHTLINGLQTGTSNAIKAARKGPLYAADTTARNALFTTYGASASNPLWVDMAGILYRTVNGTDWVATTDPAPATATFTLTPGLWTAVGSPLLVQRSGWWHLSVGFSQTNNGSISGGWTPAGTVSAAARHTDGGVYNGAAAIFSPGGASVSRINRATGAVEFASPGFAGTTATTYNLGLMWPAT